MGAAHDERCDDSRVRRLRGQTMATLLVGYAGYYLCRSNFSVVKPLLLAEYGPTGLTKAHLGWVGTIGTLLYAVGKVTNGLGADRRGGRAMFLGGMWASVACTVAVALLAPAVGASLVLLVAVMTGVWAVNRYFQSMGWVGLVGVAARWFPVAAHATVMGVLSLSYLFGDAFAAAYLGTFIRLGARWSSVVLVSAVTLAAIAWACGRWLRGSPRDYGLPEPPAREDNLYHAVRDDGGPPSSWLLLAPLLTSRAFWLYAAMNFGLTMIRETFREWQPTFLYEVTGLDAGHSAWGSMVFPLVGGLAALLAGRASDRLGGRHERVFLPCLVCLVLSLALLAVLPFAGRPVAALLVTSLVSFCLLAPYTLFSGVVALDLGGQVGAATTAGMIDAAGYVGGMLAGAGIGSLAERAGWSAAFWALAAMATLTLGAGALYTRGRRLERHRG